MRLKCVCVCVRQRERAAGGDSALWRQPGERNNQREEGRGAVSNRKVVRDRGNEREGERLGTCNARVRKRQRERDATGETERDCWVERGGGEREAFADTGSCLGFSRTGAKIYKCR